MAVTHPSSPPSHESPEPDVQRRVLVATAELLANALDMTVRIPGTRLYLGLDPLLGLIPGIGDVLAGLIGAIILGLATRLRLPRIVIVRMSLNLLLNGVIGAIPIVGDLFSVWFRSNTRNAELLREAAAQSARVTRGDWIYVFGLLGGTVLLLLGFVTLVIWLVISLWSRFSGIQ